MPTEYDVSGFIEVISKLANPVVSQIVGMASTAVDALHGKQPALDAIPVDMKKALLTGILGAQTLSASIGTTYAVTGDSIEVTVDQMRTMASLLEDYCNRILPGDVSIRMRWSVTDKQREEFRLGH